MASLKILLWDKPNAEGLFPIALRIIKNRKPAYIYIHYIDKEDWDDENKCVKRSNPNYKRINSKILKELSAATDSVIELEAQKKQVSSKIIKSKVKPVAGATFANAATLYLKGLKAEGRYNEYVPNKTRLERFIEFYKDDLTLQEITVPLLTRFKSYVKTKYKLSDRTVANYLSAIRSAFSFAVNQELVSKEFSPFGKKGIKIKFPDSSKVGLDLSDIERLETVELVGKAHHARNLWLFSYYFAGMRVSDVLRLQWSDFQNDRLYYGMGKNDKFGSLKVPEKAKRILAQYHMFRKNKKDLVFPELKGVDLNDEFNTERVIGFKASAIDKNLKERVAPKALITKTLTMHISRHTFAQLAGDEIPLPVLQRLYRHSNITTTIGYQSNFTNKDTDDALDKVLKKKEKNVPNPS